MLRVLLFGLSCLAAVLALPAQAQTQIVVLGTGTPVPDPLRAGSSIAVVTGGQAYVFDAGDGSVQRAIQAAEWFGVPELVPQNIDHLFLTHLHSDHIQDLSALATSRWWSREQRLRVFGPRGLAEYVGHVNAASAVEARIRLAGTPEELVTDPEGYRADAVEIEDGIVFENEDISVEAFTVSHGDIRPSFGYRIVTADRTIVISGDTAFSETLIEKAKEADLLFHEAVSGDNLGGMSEFWQHYHGASHTTTDQLVAVAEQARPGLLVLYHVLFIGATPGEFLAEITRDYDGPVVLADDLDVF